MSILRRIDEGGKPPDREEGGSGRLEIETTFCIQPALMADEGSPSLAPDSPAHDRPTASSHMAKVSPISKALDFVRSGELVCWYRNRYGESTLPTRRVRGGCPTVVFYSSLADKGISVAG